MHRDYRQSKAFQELLRGSGAQLVELPGDEVGCLLSPRFLPWVRALVAPYVRDPAALSVLEAVARRRRAALVNVVPGAEADSEEGRRWADALARGGFRHARFGAAPTKTLMLDLTLSEEALLRGMKEKTRYHLRLAGRRGLVAEVVSGPALLAAGGAPLDRFYRMYAGNCRRLRLRTQPRPDTERFVAALGEAVFAVFVRSAAGEDLAVALHVASDGTVVYELNGSTEEGRKAYAPTLAVWEGIREGQRRGCARYDFGGTFDERFDRAQKRWQGFSRFKAGFGAREVAYLGSFSRWVPFLRRSPAARGAPAVR